MGTLRELFPRNACGKQHHGRHVLFEYVMLRGINDSLEDARRLLVLTQGIECKFNLIGFNPHIGTRFLPSPTQQVGRSKGMSARLSYFAHFDCETWLLAEHCELASQGAESQGAEEVMPNLATNVTRRSVSGHDL